MNGTLEKLDAALAGIQFDPELFPALRDKREKAFQVHQGLGIPTTKHEEWKYTSLRDLSEAYFVAAGPKQVSAEQLASTGYPGWECVQIVFVNGHYCEELSSPLQEQAGVEIRNLCCATKDPDPVFMDHFGSLIQPQKNTFAALNTVTFTCGAYIRIHKNVKAQKPVHIVNLSVPDYNDAVGYNAVRHLIIAEEGSEALVVESYLSIGEGKTLSNAAAEIFVAPNAQLEHVKIQRENIDAYHIANTEVRQERDSTFKTYGVTFGGKLTRNDLNVFLNGSNLHSRMDGIVVLSGQQHADNHTQLDHAFPHCDSFEVYKHVLRDKSRAVFNGKIYVHQDAQKTDAKQTNQTLLLSPDAAIDTKPQLEIFADDVKCTHGATVGYLDQAPLFYLQARGIPKEKAEAMMVYAFAADILERISDHKLVEGLEALLYEKLD